MVRSRAGFTLIELLIVVVIIGILAAVAIPKFQDTKQTTVLNVMKADLRRAAGAAEGYYAENNTFVGLSGVTGSPGITLTAGTITAGGYIFEARHASYPGIVCDVSNLDRAGRTAGVPGGASCMVQ